MATSTAIGLSDGGSSYSVLAPDSTSVAVAPIVLLNADRAEALLVLEAALASAPEELKPNIERLMGELAREFDATIAHLETTTTP
jgi:hypothetical protein